MNGNGRQRRYDDEARGAMRSELDAAGAALDALAEGRDLTAPPRAQPPQRGAGQDPFMARAAEAGMGPDAARAAVPQRPQPPRRTPSMALGDPAGTPRPVDPMAPTPPMAERRVLAQRLRNVGDPYASENAAEGGIVREGSMELTDYGSGDPRHRALGTLGDPRGTPRRLQPGDALPSMRDRRALAERLAEAGDPYPEEGAAVGGMALDDGRVVGAPRSQMPGNARDARNLMRRAMGEVSEAEFASLPEQRSASAQASDMLERPDIMKALNDALTQLAGDAPMERRSR